MSVHLLFSLEIVFSLLEHFFFISLDKHVSNDFPHLLLRYNFSFFCNILLHNIQAKVMIDPVALFFLSSLNLVVCDSDLFTDLFYGLAMLERDWIGDPVGKSLDVHLVQLLHILDIPLVYQLNS